MAWFLLRLSAQSDQSSSSIDGRLLDIRVFFQFIRNQWITSKKAIHLLHLFSLSFALSIYCPRGREVVISITHKSKGKYVSSQCNTNRCFVTTLYSRMFSFGVSLPFSNEMSHFFVVFFVSIQYKITKINRHWCSFS